MLHRTKHKPKTTTKTKALRRMQHLMAKSVWRVLQPNLEKMWRMQRQLGACACSNNALNKIVAQGRAKGFNQVAKCMKLGRSHKTNACTKNTEKKRERKSAKENIYKQTYHFTHRNLWRRYSDRNNKQQQYT